jgi:hypothetical protein
MRFEERRRCFLDGLLEGRGSEPAFAHDAASALRISPDGRYVVVVGTRASDGDLAAEQRLPDVAAILGGWGLRSTWRRGSSRCVGIVDVAGVGDDGPAAVARALGHHAGGRVGISTAVDTLAEVPTARHLAETALATLRSDQPGVALLEERLPAALVAASPTIAALLVRASLGGVLDLPEDERGPLLDTLRAYCATAGSATESAGRLHCHRNTVLKRLRRVEEVTGATLSDPRVMLSLSLAVEAVGLHVRRDR